MVEHAILASDLLSILFYFSTRNLCNYYFEYLLLVISPIYMELSFELLP